MLPDPTDRLRFRLMTMADLDDVTAVLSAPDPVHVDRPARNRDDAARWIEWQQRNYAEHGFGLWVVETDDGDFVGDCGLTMQDVDGVRAVRECAAFAGIDHLIALIRPENLCTGRTHSSSAAD